MAECRPDALVAVEAYVTEARGGWPCATERGSADLEALHRRLVEGEAEPGLLRHRELAALDRRRLLVEAQGPRHVLDGEADGDRRDQVHVDLRDQMAHDRQVERLGHARD